MKIKFLGTGAAEGIPSTFCNCRICEYARRFKGKDVRGRFQIMINDDLLTDYPPDSFFNSIRHNIDFSKVTDILITHSHSDHFYPEDLFMRGLNSSYSMKESILTVHGSECVTNRLRELNVGFPKGSLSEIPVGKFKGYDVIGRCVEYNTLTPFSNCDISGYRVTVIPSEHVNYEPSFVYGITKNNKTVFILSDTAMLTDKEIAYFADSGLKADAIIYDCTYGEDERNEGHMNIEDNCLLRDKFISLKVADNNTKHIISHLAHSLMKTHGELCEMGNKYSFIVAYDGMEIEI